MQDVIRQHLLRAQQHMKRQSDKSRSERQFAVGDWVFLKLQPYVQSLVSHRSCQKLAFRVFGPYRVIERIGSVAYHLALPETTAIHPVFHVSQLKTSHGSEPVATSLPNSICCRVSGSKAGATASLTSSNHPIEQGLIRWSHMPASLATWENQFPRAPAWGHTGSQGRANVNTMAATVHGLTTSGAEGDKAGPSKPEPRVARKPNTFVTGPMWSG
jgi:hypothetical protein